jgi:GxxExxY protein
LTERIIGCGIRVHETFGPGLFESVYTQCLVIELREAGLKVAITPRLPLEYRGVTLEAIFQPGMVVENTVIVEVKAVEVLPRVHHAQLLTYLKLSGCPIGLLMNFNVTHLKEGIRRFTRPDVHKRLQAAVPPEQAADGNGGARSHKPEAGSYYLNRLCSFSSSALPGHRSSYGI